MKEFLKTTIGCLFFVAMTMVVLYSASAWVEEIERLHMEEGCQCQTRH
jgi:hypothetical protein